jgi:hypothetical protein
MAVRTKAHVPLVSATQFNVSPQVIADESDYSGVVNAGTGDWVLGSAMPKGRALLVIVETGVLSGTPTGLQVALYGSGTDADGSGGAIITATATEWTTPAGDTVYQAEIPLSYVSDLTKYYSLGVACKGGGSTSIVAGATALVLDPVRNG